jgi:hypothetical protein
MGGNGSTVSGNRDEREDAEMLPYNNVTVQVDRLKVDGCQENHYSITKIRIIEPG